MYAEIIGYIATAIMAVGSIWIAHKNVAGLWAMLLGNILWIASGYLAGLTSLIVVSIMMGALDYYGIYRWGKE